MKVCQRIIFFSLMLFLVGLLMVDVVPVVADEELIWDQYVLGTGEGVVSPILKNGKTYRVVADEVWWHDYPLNKAADAQYYTTDGSNNWFWVNHFAAPGGHSFLQIDGGDVDWGAFSNGDTGHTYTIYYTGEGASVTFKIVDWVDSDYGNNDCKIRVRIYEAVTVGGHVVESNPLESVKLWVFSAMMVAVLITVPIVKYFRSANG